MIFLVPIVMSDYSFPGVERLVFSSVGIVKLSVERVLVLLALAAWGWDLLCRGGRVRHTPIDWLILAWLGWVTVTTITSLHWPTALLGILGRYEGLVTFATYSVIYFLVLQFADSADKVLRMAQTLFVASLIVAVYGLLQFAGVVPVPDDSVAVEELRVISTYNNAMLLGGFLVFSVTVALGLALRERNMWRRLLYWAGFGLNGLTLVVSMTRSAWAGGMIGLVLLAIMGWRQQSGMRRVDWIPTGIFGAAAFAIIWRSLSNSSEILNIGKRLASVFQFDAGSGQTRTEIWKAAIEAIKQRPLFGWGADSFNYPFSRLKPLEYVRDAGEASRVDNAHNYPLHLASGIGIIGALLFFAIWLWAGIRSFKTVFGRAGSAAGIIRGAFWAASAGYLFQLLFGISIPGVTFLLWIALAVVLAPTARTVRLRPAKLGKPAAAALALLVAIGIAFQVVVLVADNGYAVASEDMSPRPYSERKAAALRAVEFNPLVPEHRSTLAAIYLEKMASDAGTLEKARANGEHAEAARQAFEDSFRAAESALEEAISATPYDYANYVNLAILYNFAGATLSEDFYRHTIDTAQAGLEVMPLGTAIRVQLAQALDALGRTDEAVATLEDCMRIDAKDGNAAVHLAQIYQRQGRAAEALVLLKSVDALAPGQPKVRETIKALEAESPQM
jgi:O-antigen ligase/Flp pilus assembly protein TadD